MPRIARKDLKGTFFHIMSQGINREQIFNEDVNKNKYKELLKKYSNEFKIEIVAYCIMDNHAHILIYVKEVEQISNFMKKLNCNYANFYNMINDRVGYVFRNRFYTVTIEDLMQLYVCIAYIHNNPVKANIVKNPSDYQFSSYREYCNFEDENNIISKNVEKIVFNGLNKEERNKIFSKIHTKNEIHTQIFEEKLETDYKQVVRNMLNNNLTINEIIIILKNKYKLSERNIADIMKITRHIVRKVLK